MTILLKHFQTNILPIPGLNSVLGSRCMKPETNAQVRPIFGENFLGLTFFSTPSGVHQRNHVRHEVGFPRIQLWRLNLDSSKITPKDFLSYISGNFTERTDCHIIKTELMCLFSIGSGSTNCLEHYSKWADPEIGINLSADSNVGLSSENSNIHNTNNCYNQGFCYVNVLPGDTDKNIKIVFL